MRPAPNRKGAQYDGLYRAEDRGGRADAERQRETATM